MDTPPFLTRSMCGSYHIISNHSPNVQKFGNQLDYLGIVFLMWGSTISTVYYGFFCDPALQKLYWLNVSVLASLCVVATLHPRFSHSAWRSYRAAMYAGLGLSAVVFVVHGLIRHGWTTQNQRMSLDWMALMATSNLVGAAIYTARVRVSRFFVYDDSRTLSDSTSSGSGETAALQV